MEVQGAQSGQEYAVRLQFKACHVLTIGSVHRCWRLLVDAWAGMQVCCAVQVLSCGAACLQSLRSAACGPALACCIHC